MAESCLSDYLAEVARRPFRWEADDCAMFVLGWFDRLSMKQRAHLWRDGYHDEESCKAFIVELGGFEAAAQQYLGGWYGARRTGPAVGNAVIAEVRGEQAMGIRVTSTQIALRTPKGLWITHRARPIVEWGIV